MTTSSEQQPEQDSPEFHDDGENGIYKKVITDLDGAPYIVRWSAELCWPFTRWSIKVHQILQADHDRCTHDHPWWFLRFILWGGYDEIYANAVTKRLKKRTLWPLCVYFCPSGFRHRITKLNAKSSWSLVLCGPRTRHWGFFTLEGWMPWSKFISNANRIPWCEERSGRKVKSEQVP